MKSKLYNVKEGRTEIKFPFNEEVRTVLHPSFGPGTYEQVGKSILENNLRLPTAEETAALLHSAYCGPESYKNKFQIQKIRNIMRDKWINVFNRNLWTDRGVYIIPDKKAKEFSEELNINELEKILRDAEELDNGVKYSEGVRFAPKESCKLGYHSAKELAENGFVIASYGVNGAKQ